MNKNTLSMFYLTYLVEITVTDSFFSGIKISVLTLLRSFELINNEFVVLKYIPNILREQDFYVIQSYG